MKSALIRLPPLTTRRPSKLRVVGVQAASRCRGVPAVRQRPALPCCFRGRSGRLAVFEVPIGGIFMSRLRRGCSSKFGAGLPSSITFPPVALAPVLTAFRTIPFLTLTVAGR